MTVLLVYPGSELYKNFKRIEIPHKDLAIKTAFALDAIIAIGLVI